MKRSKIQVGLIIVLLVACGWIVLQRQAILDWWKLRDYTPPTAVVQLADDDTMTSKAEHLLYVNHPDITTGTAFTSHCRPAVRRQWYWVAMLVTMPVSISTR